MLICLSLCIVLSWGWETCGELLKLLIAYIIWLIGLWKYEWVDVHRAMIPGIVKSMNIFHNTVFKNWMPFSRNCCVKRNDKFYNVSLTIVITDKKEINFSGSCKKEIQLCTLIHSVSPLNDSSRKTNPEVSDCLFVACTKWNLSLILIHSGLTWIATNSWIIKNKYSFLPWRHQHCS